MKFLQAALTGMLLGGLHALMAAGLSLSWGVLRIINLAHFGLILLGAYLTFQIASSWHIDPIVTLVVTIPVLFAAGALLQWGFDRLAVTELNSLLLSFGLLVAMVQAVSNLWTADFQQMTAAVNPYATRSLSVGRLVFPTTTLIAFVLSVVLIGGGHLALQRTFIGRALRAFAMDRTIAAAFGIDHRRVSILLAGIAGGSAAVAGMLFAVSTALAPFAAFEWFGIVFAVVILGGIGNVVGTLLAGLLVGALSSLASVIHSPATEPFVVFSLIVVALLVRPQGLFVRAGGH
jgi:branched-chain amino acid transport system permease protein